MDEFVFKLLEAGGSIGGIVAVVVIFLRAMDRRDVAWQEFLHDQRMASTATQEKLSAEIAANTSIIRELVSASQIHHEYTKQSLDSVKQKLGARKTKS